MEKASKAPLMLSEAIKLSLASIEEVNMNNSLMGIPCGLADIDRITGGFQKQDLVVVAARPAMGKTSFVLSCARNISVFFKKPLAFFSLEMSATQLVNRLISSETEIDLQRIVRGTLAEWEWQLLHSKIGDLVEAPLLIDDTPYLDIVEFREKCYKLKSEYDVQIIVVDNLQLIRGEKTKNGFNNREQEIGSISRELKSIARELDLTILATSQLSRAVESRPGPNGKRPQLFDLRESGAIEQDADVVLFLYRPEYYGITEDESGRSMAGVGEVIIAKNRNGEIGIVPLKFISSITKFTDLEDSFSLQNQNNFLDLVSSKAFNKHPQNIFIRPSSMNDMQDDEPPF